MDTYLQDKQKLVQTYWAIKEEYLHAPINCFTSLKYCMNFLLQKPHITTLSLQSFALEFPQVNIRCKINPSLVAYEIAKTRQIIQFPHEMNSSMCILAPIPHKGEAFLLFSTNHKSGALF